MAVSFEPGYGRPLGESLGNIFNKIQQFANPNRKYQDAILSALTDPTKAQAFANMAAANPEFYNSSNPMIGKKVGASLEMLHPSIAFQNQQTVDQTVQQGLQDPNSRFAQEYVAGKTGTQTPQERQAEDTTNTFNGIKLKSLQDYENFLNKNPDVKTQSMYKSALGMTEDEFTIFKDNYNKWKQGKDLAVTNPRAFLKDFASGKVDANALESFATYNPKAFAYASSLLNQEEQEKFRLRIQSLSDSGTDRVADRQLRNMMLQAAITRSKGTGVTPSDAYKALWGAEPPEGLGFPPSTEAGVKRFGELESLNNTASFRAANSKIVTSIVNALANRSDKYDKGRTPEQRAAYDTQVKLQLNDYNIQNGTKLHLDVDKHGKARILGPTGVEVTTDDMMPAGGLDNRSIGTSPNAEGFDPTVTATYNNYKNASSKVEALRNIDSSQILTDAQKEAVKKLIRDNALVRNK